MVSVFKQTAKESIEFGRHWYGMYKGINMGDLLAAAEREQNQKARETEHWQQHAKLCPLMRWEWLLLLHRFWWYGAGVFTVHYISQLRQFIDPSFISSPIKLPPSRIKLCNSHVSKMNFRISSAPRFACKPNQTHVYAVMVSPCHGVDKWKKESNWCNSIWRCNLFGAHFFCQF